MTIENIQTIENLITIIMNVIIEIDPVQIAEANPLEKGLIQKNTKKCLICIVNMNTFHLLPLHLQ